MADKENHELSSEEKQLDAELKSATKQYGQFEDHIRNMPPDKGPQPVLKPIGAPVIRQAGRDEKIAGLRQKQETLKEAISEKADEITRDSKPEIKEKVAAKCDEWKKSDIYNSYLGEKHKTIDESQEYLLTKNVQSADKQIQNKVEQNAPSKDVGIESYDLTSQLSGSKFLNKAEFQEKGNEQKDFKQDNLSKDSWIESYDTTINLGGSKFLDSKEIEPGKDEIANPAKDDKQPTEPEPSINGEDD